MTKIKRLVYKRVNDFNLSSDDFEPILVNLDEICSISGIPNKENLTAIELSSGTVLIVEMPFDEWLNPKKIYKHYKV